MVKYNFMNRKNFIETNLLSKNNAQVFSRSWFACAYTLFGELIYKLSQERFSFIKLD
ncbi:Uncharacterised protein [Candidatus Ornithobacterium hominis]|nr:Uncharacterised protein [Candidatus Ornithobacterium hominis]